MLNTYGNNRTLQAYGFVYPTKHKEKPKMEMEVKKSVNIEDGKHTGTIKKVEYRTEPYPYTDICVSIDDVEDKDFLLKYGCPTNSSEEGKLMQLVKVFDNKVKVGDKIDIDVIFIGRKVEFMTLLKESNGKKYTNIVVGSLKPIDK